MLVYNSGAFSSWPKSKTARSYSLQEKKSCLEFLINNSFFQAGSKISHQVIVIPMGSYPMPFFANPLFFCESRWLKSIKNTSYEVVRKFGNIFRFIGDVTAINDRNKFENHYNEIYPPRLILKKENIQTFIFNVVRFPHKSSTITSKIFFAEILRICWATTNAEARGRSFRCYKGIS